jgi:hypothetical protein
MEHFQNAGFVSRNPAVEQQRFTHRHSPVAMKIEPRHTETCSTLIFEKSGRQSSPTPSTHRANFKVVKVPLDNCHRPGTQVEDVVATAQILITIRKMV